MQIVSFCYLSCYCVLGKLDHKSKEKSNGASIRSSGAIARNITYSKTCAKRPLSKRPKIVFNTNHRLMQVRSIAECSKGSILQYFQPSLRYNLSLRPLFDIFLSGRFTQVLLSLYYTRDISLRLMLLGSRLKMGESV